MRQQLVMIVMTTALAAGVAFGCGPEDEPTEREREAVDHAEVQQSVTDHSQAAVEAIVDGLALLESAEMFDEYATQQGCIETSEDSVDDNAAELAEDDGCASAPGASEQLDDESDAIGDILKQRIFAEANVESEDGDSVTYLLAGDVVCDKDDFEQPVVITDPDDGDDDGYDDDGYDYDDDGYDEEAYQQCVDDVDDLEIRLEAAKYAGNTFEIDIMVGPEKVQPVTLVFSQSEVSATATLDAMEPAAEHIADVVGEQAASFPDTFSGQIKGGYYLQGDEIRLAVDILQDIEIETEQWDVFVQAAGEVLGLGADTADEVFEASVGFGEISISGQMPGGYGELQEEPMPGDDEEFNEPEPADPIDFGVEVAGLTSTVIFDSESDDIQWTDVGLGAGPTTMSINGETVIDIDLDAGIGGVFDAAMAMQDGKLKYAVEPGIEVQIGLMFDKVAGEFDDVEAWMLNEVLTIGLDGDPNPAILVGDQIEVLRGHLSMQSQSGPGATAYAGQCLIEGQSGADDPYVDDVAPGEQFHPFEDIEAGQCSTQ